ncbi:hypothetical protein CK203_072488 [Vitis vinifera]|uniref:Uncharacterized protein n=1 Tax=Vitis vinifera TaxID=29760 RepID=A0A438F953_VITVI|nr:hypothetical protein CK203_072488 [Vitis vinifera]
MSHSDFVSKLCDALHFDQNSIKLEFTVKFEPSCLLPLHDDATLLKMFRFNEMFCHVYVSSSSEVVEGCIAPNRCAEANILKHDSSRFENSIMGSGHTFPNAAKFRDAVYLMSIAARAVGDLNIIQVHTFHNHHNHSLEDVGACQPLVRPNQSSLLIDDVIRSTPDYQPRQFKMVATNPGSIVELGHSSDGHFEQLFVAHSVSIQGFAMGCWPIIAIDSVHMNGPYRGALFSATAYDANDAMFH